MIAFVCNQTAHVMRALQLHLTIDEFKGDADIYIGSSFYDSENIARRLREEKIFKRVIWVDKKIIPQKGAVIKLMYGHSDLAHSLRKENYKAIVNFNIESEVSTVLYNLNKKSDEFICHYIEDGPGLYTIYTPKRYGKWHPYHFMGIDKPFFHTDKWWFSEPDLMTVPVEKHVKLRLPHFDVYNISLLKIINRIYNYSRNELLEKADILIMEESFYVDDQLTNEINDYEIYSEIRNTFPNANILVKLHPRTSDNRFKNDFQILQGQGIPWEVYLLNLLNENITLPIQIGVRCHTLQSDMLCYGAEGRKISLSPMFVGKLKPNRAGVYDVDEKMIKMLKEIRDQYEHPENFQFAYSVDDLMNILKNWLK